MSERRIDVVRVPLSRETIELPWESRQALLDEFRHLDSMSGVVKAFENAGTSEPVVLTREQKFALVEVIEFWGHNAPGGLTGGLPEQVFEFRNALHDDLYDTADALPTDLFDVARALLDDTGQLRGGPALVVAQAAVEVAFEATTDMALLARSVHDPLRSWVIHGYAQGQPWSPRNEKLQALWLALTGDTIKGAESWEAYVEGAKLRNDVVHRAVPVSREQAERFIEAGSRLVDHFFQQVTRVSVEVEAAALDDAAG